MSEIPTFDQCTSQVARLLRLAENLAVKGSEYPGQQDRILAVAKQWRELAETLFDSGRA